MISTISISLPFVFLLLSGPLLAEQMTIDKQVQLSHRFVTPYVVSRASNGDFIVAGTYEELGYRPWATRIGANGEGRWGFVEGECDRSPDRSIPQQRFNGVIELPDQTTVLCGLKYEDKRATIILDHFGVDGSLI